MKNFILNIVVFIGYSLISAQEYLPLHLNYKALSQEKKYNIEEILISYINEKYSLFDDKIDSISNETAKNLEEKYRLTNVSRYAYWKGKKGNLFKTSTRVVQNKKDYKENIPFWLSMHKGRYINSSIAMGVIQKHKNKFKIWDKKTAIKDLTPIVTAKEALIYLYLMEGVFPISDFSFLCDPTKIGLFNEETEDNYTISDKNIKPTQVFEIDTFFIINVFYYNYDNNCIFEIGYKLLKNGNYEIINKRLIYKNPEDIIDNVLD